MDALWAISLWIIFKDILRKNDKTIKFFKVFCIFHKNCVKTFLRYFINNLSKDIY